jgi:CPA2 family monovalent cation:H+ antiporter-2
MHAPSNVLEDLALVLCVAAVTAVLFRRLRQPVVLGYLIAGLIVGPHVPIPLFADRSRIHALADLGVTLVMFSVGLELSVRRLLRVVPAAGVTGVIQISTMMSLGYFIGQAFGWTVRESLFTGALVAISSTMIVVRVFAEQKVGRALSEVVLGVLVMQDLAAVLLLAMLTALATGSEEASGALANTATRLLVFLVVSVVIGFALVPRTVRAIARQRSSETLLIASIGLCFALAVLAQRVGFSVALGAFLAGSLVAESGRVRQVEQLIAPLRDLFSAVFFVAVGMSADPLAVIAHWPAVIALVLAVIVGQVTSVSFGALLSGHGVRTSIQAGMSLAQIGELSFVIAGLGVQTGSARDFLYPVAVCVCLITSFTTPLLVRSSEPLAIAIEHRLPERLQTFISLYAAWLEQLRENRRRDHAPQGIARLVRLLALDAALFAAIVIGASVNLGMLSQVLHERTALSLELGRVAVVVIAILLCMPFALGIARIGRTLGVQMAARALPDTGNAVDAPHRVLIVTLELGAVLLVGAPLVALTQPFLPPLYGAGILFAVLAILTITIWRRAADLQEHVQNGAQMIVDVLSRQSGKESPHEHATPLLPGLGPVTPVQLVAHSAPIGRTLAQIDLRARSGASVIAIRRGEAGLVQPTGREELQVGDVLALAGTHEAIDLAVSILTADASADPSAEGPAGVLERMA